MFRARKQLGKRQTADGNGNGFRPKKFRADQQVPSFDDGQQGANVGRVEGGSLSKVGEGGALNVGSFGRRIVRSQRGNVLLDCEVPRYGAPVERKRCRKAGDYIIGHELGTCPGVPQTQYLARKQGTDEYFLLKMISFDPETETVDKNTLQGKVLLHNEYTLLSMLDDLEGVIHHHGFFSDYAFDERQIENGDGTVQSVYTGGIRRRLILVLDCVHAHEFCERSSAFISMQRFITVTKYSELEALQLFYEVVKVVEKLHERNIIHRDLKLNNIVLDRRTKRIVLTNFFLAKQLINENEVLFDQRGSPAYISPDVLGGKPYKGKPSDIWALGVILYTIIYGKFPFLDTTPTALFRKIREVDYIIPVGFKTLVTTNILIKSMLRLNPEERFTATEVRTQLEQMLQEIRPPKVDIDQLVPEPSSGVDESLSSLTVPNNVAVDQSIPIEQEPIVTYGPGSLTAASAAIVSSNGPMDIDSPPVTIVPGPEPDEPRHELSTVQFSRVLEENNPRHALGPDGVPKPRLIGPVKKVATPPPTYIVYPQIDQQNQLPGGVAMRSGIQEDDSTNAARLLQRTSQSLPPMGGGSFSGNGRGRQRNRFNFNLNLQYVARSYNSAARAVVAAVAAVRGTGATTNGSGVELVRNANGTISPPASPDNGQSSPLPLASFVQAGPTLQTPPVLQPNVLFVQPEAAARAQANTSSMGPTPNANNTNVGQPRQSLPSLMSASERLYEIMNHISNIRSRTPSSGGGSLSSVERASPSGWEADDGIGHMFDGTVTQEMADKIVPYLIVHLRHHEWVVELFRTANGGPTDPDQWVNNLLELLRQLRVRMEARHGQIVIRPVQTRERRQFLGVLLRLAGYNDDYFTNRRAPSPILA